MNEENRARPLSGGRLDRALQQIEHRRYSREDLLRVWQLATGQSNLDRHPYRGRTYTEEEKAEVFRAFTSVGVPTTEPDPFNYDWEE